MSAIRAARRRFSDIAIVAAALVGIELVLGRVGPVGFGDRAIPVEVLGVGVVAGSLYGLVGVGMVLVWRSHRILNLAQAQLGAVPAVAALLVIGERGVPYLVAVPVALIVAAGLGAASEVLVVRRFDRAPRLAATIATLGLAQLLVAVELFLPRWVAGLEGIAHVPSTPLSSWRWAAGVVTFTGDHLAAVVVSAAITLAVTLGLQRSSVGVAVRAAASQPVRAAQLGIPVGRLRAGVWAVAAVASAAAVLLRVPLVGFSFGGLIGPGVLLYGLATATIARFEHPGRALAAGMAVGVVEQGVVFSTGRSGAADIAMFVLVAGALLAQGAGRGRLAPAGTWLPAREVPALPVEVWSAPPVRVLRAVVSVGLGLLVVVLPLVLSAGQPTRFTTLCAAGVVAVSGVLLTGWSGQLGLGQMAIAGVGAVVGGALITSGGRGADLLVVLAVAAISGALVGVLVGLPVVRLAGPQLAITTLAFAFAVPAFIADPGPLGWLLPDGPVLRPRLFGRVDLSPEHRFSYVALALLVLALVVAHRFRRTRAGRLAIASRDDLRTVAGVGTEPVRVRAFTFAVSGALAGAAGAVIAWNQGVVEASTFSPQRSLDVVSAIVIGGISSPVGAVAGVVWVFGLPLLFPGTPAVAALGSGVGVLLVLLVQPGGLAVLAGAWWHRLAHALAGVNPRGPAVRGGSAGAIDGVAEALAQVGRAPRPDVLVRRLDLVELDGAPLHANLGANAAVLSGEGPQVADPDANLGANAAVSSGEGPQVARVAVAPALEIRGVTVRRGSDVVLRDVSLSVAPGECVALVGTNGAGKSTLLDVIAAGLEPAGGSVRVHGVQVTAAPPRQVAELGVSTLVGGRACFPDLTVDEHLRLALGHVDGPPARTADELYARYPQLEVRRAVLAGNLSGGEQHLLGLAVAGLRRPSLLLIDELTLGLSAEAIDALVADLGELSAAGCSMLLVDQSLERIAPLCDRAIFLERGEVRYDGPPDALLANDDLVRPALSTPSDGGATPRSGRIDHRGADALVVSDLSVSYGGVAALRGVDLRVRAGSVVGIAGGNGAGKTTLLDAISGHVGYRGSVHVGGVRVDRWSTAKRTRAGLGRSFQQGSGQDALTVRDCLALAQDRSVTDRSLLAAVLGLPGAVAAETDVVLRAELLAADAGLLDWLEVPCGDLSTGLRRRLELAMAAAHEPSVLLLDEPTAGLARGELAGIAAIVRSLADEGVAVVVVDHDHGFLEQVSDRLAVIDAGSVRPGARRPSRL